MRDEFSILEVNAETAARRLLGCRLVRELDGQRLVGRIVETEAYDQADAASHSYRGETERTRVMFGPAGRLYVYFTYGMHYCANIVVGPVGRGTGVLIRAVEPIEGWDTIRHRRHQRPDHQLTNGPAKLCQAFAIDMGLSAHDLSKPPLQLLVEPILPNESIVQTTRIGISLAKDVPWRFYIKDNPYVSKP